MEMGFCWRRSLRDAPDFFQQYPPLAAHQIARATKLFPSRGRSLERIDGFEATEFKQIGDFLAQAPPQTFTA
ncbi:hypothetical protein NKJ70_28910 [Mesorhizobium sp. M0092]|uniref:hypothetical protein n=1 Tax=Mesorhizobium sp. M0092 TaxID=2956876 RepID=UPI003335A945